MSAVDGVAMQPPRGYVLVPAGTHVLTLVHEKCWLPMMQKRCAASAETSDIIAVLEAGIAYRVHGLTSPLRRVGERKGGKIGLSQIPRNSDFGQALLNAFQEAWNTAQQIWNAHAGAESAQMYCA